MKLIVSLFISFLFTQSVLSQNPEGNYIYHSEYIKFYKQNVEFDIYHGCIAERLRGQGTYEILDNYLLINTGDFNNQSQRSFCISSSTSNDSILFLIKSAINGDLIPFAHVQFLDIDNNEIGGFSSDRTGSRLLPNKMNISKIRVSKTFYEPFVFDYEPYSNIYVTLECQSIIEKSTVVFRICSLSENTLQLSLLTTNFARGKNILKSLHKLDKIKSCGSSSTVFQK